METLAGLYKCFESLGRIEEVLLKNFGMLEPKPSSLLRWRPKIELEERNIVMRGLFLSPNFKNVLARPLDAARDPFCGHTV